MTTLPMSDLWIEALYKVEFNVNPTEFLEKIKNFLPKTKREKLDICVIEKRNICLLNKFSII